MGVRSYTLRYTEARVVFSLFRSLSEFEVVLNGNQRIVVVESVLPPPLHSSPITNHNPIFFALPIEQTCKSKTSINKNQEIQFKDSAIMFPE